MPESLPTALTDMLNRHAIQRGAQKLLISEESPAEGLIACISAVLAGAFCKPGSQDSLRVLANLVPRTLEDNRVLCLTRGTSDPTSRSIASGSHVVSRSSEDSEASLTNGLADVAGLCAERASMPLTWPRRSPSASH